MNGRTIALTIVGFLIGIVAAGGIGVRVIAEVRAEDDATSLPPENVLQAPPNEYFLDPDETMISSIVVVPTSLTESDSSLAIDYQAISLAPLGGFPGAEHSSLYPRSWTLTTASGTVDGGPESADDRVALFELPPGIGVSDILSVDIIDPFMAVPLDGFFELSEGMPSTMITDGVRADLLNTRVEGEVTVVQLELIGVDPMGPAFTIQGAGPGWSAAFIETEGSTVELLWVGGDLPDLLTFRAVGIQWVQIEGVYPVNLEGLQ